MPHFVYRNIGESVIEYCNSCTYYLYDVCPCPVAQYNCIWVPGGHVCWDVLLVRRHLKYVRFTKFTKFLG